MQAESAVASVHKGVAAPAYHPRSSLLIRVHLRLHFLVPEQARNRRKGRDVDPRMKRSRKAAEYSTE
jgi:hypothetical protein